MLSGLIIYGDPATGKSTLELNLREYYLGQALSKDDYASNGTICFLGKTANRDGRVMSTGGAEAMLKLPPLPVVPWYIASLPTRGRPGVKVTWEFLYTLDELFAVCLSAKSRQQYVNRRTRFFSGRDSVRKVGAARVKYPPGVPREHCFEFETEYLEESFKFIVDELLEHTASPKFYNKLKLLEEFS